MYYLSSIRDNIICSKCEADSGVPNTPFIEDEEDHKCQHCDHIVIYGAKGIINENQQTRNSQSE